jgi:hypothetical protein
MKEGSFDAAWAATRLAECGPTEQYDGQREELELVAQTGFRNLNAAQREFIELAQAALDDDGSTG